MDDKKIGAYICTGCEIGDSLDIEALSKVATGEYKLPICKTHPNLCGPEGVDFIKKDIDNEKLNTLVIAACSPRVNTSVFQFEKAPLVERVNLREHVVWSHEPNNEDTQALAEDYIRMGIVKIQQSDVTEPEIPEEIDRTILVVGGGFTGMNAALEAARADSKVVLLEKEDSLGGFMAKLYKQYPKSLPYSELAPNGIEALVEQVNNEPNITVHTGAAIKKISGAPGLFDAELDVGGQTVTQKIGAIVMATGFKPYDATKLDHLGYGNSPDVITNVQMEELAGNGVIKRPSDDKPVESVAFIQCAGSRDTNHLPYCSSHCCMTSLKQATYLRELNPDAKVYILYKDMRTPGQYEDFYRKVQDDPRIFLTKAEVTGVSTDGGELIVEAENTLVGEKIGLPVDMVVLATGMVPNSADSEAIRKLDDAKAVIAKGEEGKQLEDAKVTAEENKHFEGAEILNLDYRLGPDLPVLQYGFPDSHFICFPYETRRTGIYAAGCVRAPMDSLQSGDDAAGAALKAIQCLELTGRGAAVHPRSGDTSFPEFFLQRCTQCKRCTEECPFGVLNEDEKGTPLPNPTRCRRCGVCMGACPERIVSFKDYSVAMIAKMIKAIEVPEEDDEKYRILGLFCENDAYPALDMAAQNRLKWNADIRIIPLRCLGSTNIVWIADSLAAGIDGILLIGCKYGDDYQCHFIQGSELANTRLGNVKETLDRLVLESERVKLVELSISDFHKLPEIIDEFKEELEEVGFNPYKGF